MYSARGLLLLLTSLTLFDSAPGHDSDDKLMYGDSGTKPIADRPREGAGQRFHLGPSGADTAAGVGELGSTTGSTSLTKRRRLARDTATMQLRLLMLTMQFKRTIIRELKPSPVDTLRQFHSMTPTSTWELLVRRAGEHTKRGTHCEDHRLTKESPSGGIYSGDSATPA